MNVLHIDSSILGAGSVSRTLSASIVARLKASGPDVQVVYRDLAAEPIPHLSGAYLGAVQSGAADLSPELQHDVAISAAVLGEFLSADIVVIGVAFYNFTVPTQLKAWVDRILVAGQTFRYNAEGRPEGLAGAKRVVLGVARGGFYGPGSPIQAAEHAETYLRTVFGFIGIQNVQVVSAEGVAVGAEQRAAAVAGAERQIAGITV